MPSRSFGVARFLSFAPGFILCETSALTCLRYASAGKPQTSRQPCESCLNEMFVESQRAVDSPFPHDGERNAVGQREGFVRVLLEDFPPAPEQRFIHL